MTASKTGFVGMCAVLLLALGSGGANAQKKGDPTGPTQPAPAAATPFSNVRRDSLLNGMQIVTLERAALRADEAFLAAVYRDHPYGHGIDGDEQTIAAIRQGDIHDFESRFYLANNAVALIVGPIRHERAVHAFKLLFGGWVKGPVVPPT